MQCTDKAAQVTLHQAILTGLAWPAWSWCSIHDPFRVSHSISVARASLIQSKLRILRLTVLTIHRRFQSLRCHYTHTSLLPPLIRPPLHRLATAITCRHPHLIWKPYCRHNPATLSDGSLRRVTVPSPLTRSRDIETSAGLLGDTPVKSKQRHTNPQ